MCVNALTLTALLKINDSDMFRIKKWNFTCSNAVAFECILLVFLITLKITLCMCLLWILLFSWNLLKYIV